MISHPTQCHLGCGHGVAWTHVTWLRSSSSLKACMMGQVTWGSWASGDRDSIKVKEDTEILLVREDKLFFNFSESGSFSHLLWNILSAEGYVIFVCVCYKRIFPGVGAL